MTMTAVRGHLTEAVFPEDYKNWEYPPPDRLFDAPVRHVVASVRIAPSWDPRNLLSY